MAARPQRSSRIRSFALTGGRTRPRHPLLLETLVSAVGGGGGGARDTTGFAELSPEQRDIYLACAQPRSVTEIAANLRMPVGVARVLINDLAEQGRVRIHPTVQRDAAPNRHLLERILHGLDSIAQ
ncbi:DUF742 domain-containing protein [Lipingzhangella sp. LS1_29]|uniref:DUF742 domain-containing protein n=1 Tax=Lipingzhangella rawalii TaxID=2055835 RepID=A0ABU2H9U6_9ACTN|nr:DUF742 domain-containing protein [Lipingzhangella rawalii]MDS1272096.1 DUF742 domain-containing protein [Lipingzhangella rawalii]